MNKAELKAKDDAALLMSLLGEADEEAVAEDAKGLAPVLLKKQGKRGLNRLAKLLKLGQGVPWIARSTHTDPVTGEVTVRIIEARVPKPVPPPKPATFYIKQYATLDKRGEVLIASKQFGPYFTNRRARRAA